MSYQTELDRMAQLMGYGASQNPTNAPKTVTLEYHVKASNGKYYGIIKENASFYVKESEPCQNIVAENFDYIGGISGKKNYCYTNYNQAYRHLEMKVHSINESHQKEADIMNEAKKPANLNNLSDEAISDMRESLNRVFEVMDNTNNIGKKRFTGQVVKESSDFKSYMVNHPGDDESNSPSGADEKTQNQPFTEPADKKFQTNRDTAKANGKPETSSKPFAEKGEKYAEDPTGNTTSESPEKSGGVENDVTGEKSKDVKDLGKAMDSKGGVATQHPTGGKAVKVNEDATLSGVEDSDVAEIDLDAILANPDGGETAVDAVEMADDVSTTDDGEVLGGVEEEPIADVLTSLVSQIEDLLSQVSGDEEFGAEEDEFFPEEDEVEEGYGMAEDSSMDTLLNNGDNTTNIDLEEGVVHKEGDHWKVKGKKSGGPHNEKDKDWKANYSSKDKAEAGLRGYFWNKEHANESVFKGLALEGTKIVNEEGTVLHDFGNHPSYQKEPMTTPPATIKDKPATEDWDDESTKSTKPYGTSVGSSEPFDEKTIKESLKKIIGSAIMTELKDSGFLKKKV